MVRSGCLALFLCASPAFASQIVAMDLKPEGGLGARLAAALTPTLHSELSRVQGVSLITQADIQAMMQLDAAKAKADCDATSCMTDIAGALGAELLLTAQISKVGRAYHASLTLIQVDGAKVLRRVTGKAKGAEEAASEAIQIAVGQLFSGELPEAASGPDSLSRRAYRAALAGLRANTLDPRLDAQASRKRVVLDLVRTELDFDAAPKLEALKYEVARGIGAFEERIALAKDANQTAHLVACIAIYREIGRDLERVKEIRARARERGVVPSSRPLRFERPEPPKRTLGADSKAYLKAYRSAQKVTRAAIKAWISNKRLAFAKQWREERQSSALSTYDRERPRERDKGITWKLLPLHAMTPGEHDRLVELWRDDKRLAVSRLATKGGKYHDVERIYLKKVQGTWRIDSW